MSSMMLDTKKRIYLQSILPKNGNLTDLLLSKEILAKIEFNTQEVEWLELVMTGNNAKWNPKKDEPISISFSAPIINFLKDIINKMDKEKTIDIGGLDLCLEIKNMDISSAVQKETEPSKEV